MKKILDYPHTLTVIEHFEVLKEGSKVLKLCDSCLEAFDKRLPRSQGYTITKYIERGFCSICKVPTQFTALSIIQLKKKGSKHGKK